MFLLKQKIITHIKAREVLDSRGNPTIETTIWAGNIGAKASVPSGASTGKYEAVELRDGDKKRFGGLGVKKAVMNVEGEIFRAVRGMDPRKQELIDRTMVELDGTANKSRLGANAILSVSLASARLAAKLAHRELYAYLARRYGYSIERMPVPLFNVINGGVHADSGLDVQEYFIIPKKGSFAERLRKSAEVYHSLIKILKSRGLSVGLGDEGGFAPHEQSNTAPFEELSKAIAKAGYKLGSDFNLGIDAAASEFYNAKKKQYELRCDGKNVDSVGMIEVLESWTKKYNLEIIEDGMSEDDVAGWQELTKRLKKKTILVGDDLFVTNPKRLLMGIADSMANSVLIKVNQIGTLTETMQAVRIAKEHGYKVVMSHRSGETTDSFIADLAVACQADCIKAGAPARGERLAKYNRLMEIESQL
jgi:enolase